MAYKFGKASQAQLATVHPILGQIAVYALAASPVDFGVTEGARSLARQRQLLAERKSKTLKSQHLPKDDGWAYAVDVMAYVDGKGTWDFRHYVTIAGAFAEGLRKSQAEYSAGPGMPIPRIRWGGSWEFLSTTGTPSVISQHTEYARRMRKAGKSPLIDGVHFELHFL